MNTIKKVWYDKDDVELGIITSVLDKYCVPYTTLQKKIVEDIFSVFEPSYRYDIRTELSTDIKSNGKSAYDFITEKVEERLRLEDMFDGTETAEDFEMRKQIIKAAGDPYNVLDKLNAPNYKGNAVLIKPTKMKPSVKKSFIDKIKDFFKNLFKKQEKPMSIEEFCEQFSKKQTKVDPIFNLIGNPIAMNTLFKDLTELAKDSTSDKYLVKFDDLPEMDKAALKKKLPEHILRSPKCKIRRIVRGTTVSLSVEYHE